jgi:hypothetical protein
MSADPNNCGGYYCSEEVGHIDCGLNRDGTTKEPPHMHCCSSGLTMDDTVIEEVHNAHGQHYWKATAQIGTIFGSEVQGELVGIGATKESALEKLKQERHKLHESIWY